MLYVNLVKDLHVWKILSGLMPSLMKVTAAVAGESPCSIEHCGEDARRWRTMTGYSPQMHEKSDPKWRPLAALPIPGEAPRQLPVE
jgi:hypothetical protein